MRINISCQTNCRDKNKVMKWFLKKETPLPRVYPAEREFMFYLLLKNSPILQCSASSEPADSAHTDAAEQYCTRCRNNSSKSFREQEGHTQFCDVLPATL
jgi:hypothetical protein